MRCYYIIKNLIEVKLELFYLILQIYKHQFIINKIIKEKKIKKLILFYDLSVSSVAYGDFFYAIYFLKILNLYKKIQLFLINDDLREDFKIRNPLYNKEKKEDELKEFASEILKNSHNKIQIKKVDWEIATKIIKKNSKEILFYHLVKKRIPIYKISYNILVKNYSKFIKKNNSIFFLNKNSLKFKKLKLPLKNYITIGLRINYKNEPERNFDVYKLNNIIKNIKIVFKQRPLVIVCDYEGTKILKKNIKYKKNIFFSKDYTKSFYEDGLIILNSDMYLQFLGTGLSVFAEHSRVPYKIFANFERGLYEKKIIRSEFFHYKANKTSLPWQSDNQQFIHTTNIYNNLSVHDLN